MSYFIYEQEFFSASHLRKSDRVRNYDRYPYVHYQEIYVLEGGYNAFYNVENARLKVSKFIQKFHC